MTRILIADDHSIFRQGLHALISAVDDFEIVAEAADGEEALEKIRALAPEVAVLDLSMPKMTGLEVSQQVSSERLSTRILLLTMHKEPERLAQALHAGVAGYVLKESTFDELIFALHQATQGGVFISPALAALQQSRREAPGLTPREQEVLDLVAVGLTSYQIAKKLKIRLKTVESHRANMMRKLDVANSAEMISRANQLGLVRDLR